jgi:hypothetical protein
MLMATHSQPKPVKPMMSPGFNGGPSDFLGVIIIFTTVLVSVDPIGFTITAISHSDVVAIFTTTFVGVLHLFTTQTNFHLTASKWEWGVVTRPFDLDIMSPGPLCH